MGALPSRARGPHHVSVIDEIPTRFGPLGRLAARAVQLAIFEAADPGIIALNSVHGTLSIRSNRFVNIPPAQTPRERWRSHIVWLFSGNPDIEDCESDDVNLVVLDPVQERTVDKLLGTVGAFLMTEAANLAEQIATWQAVDQTDADAPETDEVAQMRADLAVAQMAGRTLQRHVGKGTWREALHAGSTAVRATSGDRASGRPADATSRHHSRVDGSDSRYHIKPPRPAPRPDNYLGPDPIVQGQADDGVPTVAVVVDGSHRSRVLESMFTGFLDVLRDRAYHVAARRARERVALVLLGVSGWESPLCIVDTRASWDVTAEFVRQYLREAQQEARPELWPAPEAIASPAEFAQALMAIKRHAGLTYAAVAEMSSSLTVTTTAGLAPGRTLGLPSTTLTVQQFVRACGGSARDAERWAGAWQRLTRDEVPESRRRDAVSDWLTHDAVTLTDRMESLASALSDVANNWNPVETVVFSTTPAMPLHDDPDNLLQARMPSPVEFLDMLRETDSAPDLHAQTVLLVAPEETWRFSPYWSHLVRHSKHERIVLDPSESASAPTASKEPSPRGEQVAAAPLLWSESSQQRSRWHRRPQKRFDVFLSWPSTADESVPTQALLMELRKESFGRCINHKRMEPRYSAWDSPNRQFEFVISEAILRGCMRCAGDTTVFAMPYALLSDARCSEQAAVARRLLQLFGRSERYSYFYTWPYVRGHTDTGWLWLPSTTRLGPLRGAVANLGDLPDNSGIELRAGDDALRGNDVAPLMPAPATVPRFAASSNWSIVERDLLRRWELGNDEIDALSNLNRHVLYATHDIGRPKAEAAAARLAGLRPDLDLETRQLVMAIDLLPHDDNSIRSVALSEVDRLVRTHPSRRQLAVDLLSGYLRTPPPDGEHDLAEPTARAAIQEALLRVVRPRRIDASDDAWPELDLDLSNTVLTDFDLSGCRVRHALFTETRFLRDTTFANARFECARFDGALFDGDAVFDRGRFADTVRFDRVTFRDNAVFADVRFSGDTRFDAARFLRRVTFIGSTFRGDVRFRATEFAGEAVFEHVTLGSLVRFEQARFLDGVRFGAARFDHGSNDLPVWDRASLLDREPCWVRTDIPAAAAPQRVWPAGWSVQPTHDEPDGGHGRRWGRLVPARRDHCELASP